MALGKRDKQIIGGLTVLSLLACGFGAFRMYQLAQEMRPAPGKPLTGRLAFDAANGTIDAQKAGTTKVAFGNTPDAVTMADEYSKIQETMNKIAFEGGRQTVVDRATTKGRFLTYCRLAPDAAIFLVHVPEMRHYSGEAKEALRKMAWIAARSIVRDRAPDKQKLAVALRGVMMYDSIQIGPATGEPVVYEHVMFEVSQLYPYFR